MKICSSKGFGVSLFVLIFFLFSCSKNEEPPKEYLFELKDFVIPDEQGLLLHIGPSNELLLERQLERKVGVITETGYEDFPELENFSVDDVQVTAEGLVLMSPIAGQETLLLFNLTNQEISTIETIPESDKFLIDSDNRIFSVSEQVVGIAEKIATIYYKVDGDWASTTIRADFGSLIQISSVFEAFVEDLDGEIWFGTYDGLYHFENDTILKVENPLAIAKEELDHIQDLVVDEDGGIWMDTNGGLVLYQEGVFTLVTTLDFAFSSIRKGAGRILAFRFEGIYEIFPDHSSKFTPVHQLYPADDPQSLYHGLHISEGIIDQNQIIWMIVYGKGLMWSDTF